MHCVLIYTLTHTVASPKENQSFFFFFFHVEKSLLIFFRSNQTNPFIVQKLLSDVPTQCCAAPPCGGLGGAAAGAGGALCAADAVCCTAVLRGWRRRGDLLSSCCFPWGTGKRKCGVRRREIENVVIENNNPFLPSLPLLVVCFPMQLIHWVTDLNWSITGNVTRLWHLSIAVHKGKITALFPWEFYKQLMETAKINNVYLLLSAVTQNGSCYTTQTLYSFAVSRKKARKCRL